MAGRYEVTKSSVSIFRQTSAKWAEQDFVLEPYEIGYTTDLHTVRIGDGKSRFSELSDVGKIGQQGGGTPPVIDEAPTGTIDGINATFQALSDFVPGTVDVFVNGLKQKPADEFTTSGLRTVQLVIAPTQGETILLNYSRS